MRKVLVLPTVLLVGCNLVAGFDDFSFDPEAGSAGGEVATGGEGGQLTSVTTTSSSSGGEGGHDTVELPPIGDHVWSARFGDGGTDDVVDIAVRPNGHVVLVGTFQSALDFGGATEALMSGAGTDMFVAELDAEGQAVWAKSFGNAGVNGNEAPAAVAVAPNGDTYVVGSLSTPVDFEGTTVPAGAIGTNGFLLALDANGAVRWAEAIGGQAIDEQSQEATAVAATDSQVAIAGRYFGEMLLDGRLFTGSQGTFVATYSRGGVIANAVDVGDPATATGVAGLAFSSNGELAVGGGLEGAISFGMGSQSASGPGSGFVARLGTNLQGPVAVVAGPFGIETFAGAANGRLVMGGTFNDPVDYGFGQLTSVGGGDGLVLGFAPGETAIVSSLRVGGTEALTVAAVEVRADGELLVAGTFRGESQTLGEPPLAVDVDRDRIFVAVLAADGTVRMKQQSTGDDTQRFAGASRGGSRIAVAFTTLGDDAAMGGNTLTNERAKGDIVVAAFVDDGR